MKFTQLVVQPVIKENQDDRTPLAQDSLLYVQTLAGKKLEQEVLVYRDMTPKQKIAYKELIASIDPDFNVELFDNP